MRRQALLSLALVAFISVAAQDEKIEEPAPAWSTGGMFSVMGGQSGSRNWAPTGSEKFTLAALGSLHLWATKNWGKYSWDNTADLSYGLVNAQSQGIRRMEDKIDLYSKWGYHFKGIAALGVVGNLRTQFTNGYDYTETPRKRISGFFAPAYITFSPGIQLRTKNSSLAFHAGPAVRFVVVTNEPYSLVYQGGIKPDGTQERPLASMFGVDPGKEVRWEAGVYASTLFKKELVKNVAWKTRLDLNFDLRQDDPFATDIYWTNTVGMTVNKWLKVNYSFDLYYDEDVRTFGPARNEFRTQMRSLLGVGLGVAF